MRGFDIVKIDPIIDFFNIMTYDIHGTWDSSDNSIGAIAQAHTNLTEIDLAMQLLWRNHIDPARGSVLHALWIYTDTDSFLSGSWLGVLWS
jgi:GH18 family chitinase